MVAGEKQTIEKVLEEKGVYVCVVSGNSMLPLLRDRQDTVVLRPKKQRLNVLDVVLYKAQDNYVLHRVIKVLEDGYVMRGDNTYLNEIVKEEAVFGVLEGFYRDGEYFSVIDKKCVKYAKKWIKSYSLRHFKFRLKKSVYKIFHSGR